MALQTRLNLQNQEPISRHIQEEAVERLIAMLEANSTGGDSLRPMAADPGKNLSQLARLRAARARYALAKLEINGCIERPAPGAYILRRHRAA